MRAHGKDGFDDTAEGAIIPHPNARRLSRDCSSPRHRPGGRCTRGAEASRGPVCSHQARTNGGLLHSPSIGAGAREAWKEAGMIVVCGEALVDMVPSKCGPEEGYVPRPGGSPSNVAVGLARLEVPVAFLGKVSSDPFGRLLRRHLETNAVDLRYVVTGTEHTTLAFVARREGEEEEYSFYAE